MNVEADKPRTIAGEWLIAVSVLMGIVSILAQKTAVSSLIAIIVSALLAIICMVSAIAALFRRDLALVRGRVIAIAILLFPTVAFVTIGRLHLVERIRVYSMQDCALGGISVEADRRIAVCDKQNREAWADIDAIIYDSSDQVALPQGKQSRSWWLAASQLRLPFDQMAFRAVPLGDHYYLVQFDEDRAVFTNVR